MRKRFPCYCRRPIQLQFFKRSGTSGNSPSLAFGAESQANQRAGAVGGPCGPAPPPWTTALKPLPWAACTETRGRLSGGREAPPLTSEGRLVSLGRGQLQVPGHRQSVPPRPAWEAFPGLCHLLMRAPRRRRGLNGPMSGRGRGLDERRARPGVFRVGSLARVFKKLNDALSAGWTKEAERAR